MWILAESLKCRPLHHHGLALSINLVGLFPLLQWGDPGARSIRLTEGVLTITHLSGAKTDVRNEFWCQPVSSHFGLFCGQTVLPVFGPTGVIVPIWLGDFIGFRQSREIKAQLRDSVQSHGDLPRSRLRVLEAFGTLMGFAWASLFLEFVLGSGLILSGFTAAVTAFAGGPILGALMLGIGQKVRLSRLKV